MLFLVEGLNCSGKSTFIDDISKGIVLTTPWLNPLRNKSHYLNYQSYHVGAYEGILGALKDQIGSTSLYWDRTWISSYAYGTLEHKSFEYLAEKYAVENVSVVFMDTTLELCIDRWKNSKRDEDKSYVKFDEEYWSEVQEKLKDAVTFLSKKGIPVHIIK